MIDQPPEALVKGCNDPISIGVLSDWIEEQYGIALNYEQNGWSDGVGYSNDIAYGYGNGNGIVYGFGYGSGYGYGNGIVYGYGNGNGYYYGYGESNIFNEFNLIDGNGTGYGEFFGFDYGDGRGCGIGSKIACGYSVDLEDLE